MKLRQELEAMMTAMRMAPGDDARSVVGPEVRGPASRSTSTPRGGSASRPATRR